MTKFIRSLIAIFLMGITVLFSACGDSKGGGKPGDQTAVKDYKVMVIEGQTTSLYADFPATIEGQQIVEIRPRVDGYIEHIYVDEGAMVKKGQHLFRINGDLFKQQVQSASANVKIAQANVKSAEMQVNKVRPLVEKDIISKFELESAQYNLQSMKAALAQAQAQLSNARTNLSYTNVTSPVDGVIGRIPYKVGALVSSNIAQPLTTVADVESVYAYFSMNEKQVLDFTRSTSGSNFQAKLSKLPQVQLVLADGTLYPQKGRIETASALINTQTGSSNFRATFPNLSGLLRSGSTGAVRIPTHFDNALLIPQKSTYEIQGKRFVYVSEGDSVRSAEVQVTPSSENQAFVVRDGLKAGDKIVIEGIASLREGLKIKPVKVDADSVLHSLDTQY